MVVIHLNISSFTIGILEAIGRSGKASSGYAQDTDFCIQKALDEFIVKYTGKDAYDLFALVEKEIKTHEP